MPEEPIKRPSVSASELTFTDADLSGINKPPLRFWHNHGAPGINFSQPYNQDRVSDPRKIPGRTINHLPEPLQPCELHSAFPAHLFIPICEQYVWKPGESLWYGTMEASHLERRTNRWSSIYPEIIDFFNNPRTVTWDSNKNKYISHMPEGWRPTWGKPHITTPPDYPPNMSTELLAKALWLVTEYLDNDKKFNNPLCAHYNPNLRDNIIHPGGMRKKLLKMYNLEHDPVEVFYFNTGGFYYQEHMKDLEIKQFHELVETVFDNQVAHGALVAEHGTLIPHIYVGSTEILNRQYEFLDLITHRVTQPGFSLSFSEPWCYEEFHKDLPCILPHTEFGNAYCNVVIRTENHPWVPKEEDFTFYHETLITMSIIHALLQRPYQDEKISIGFNHEQNPA